MGLGPLRAVVGKTGFTCLMCISLLALNLEVLAAFALLTQDA